MKKRNKMTKSPEEVIFEILTKMKGKITMKDWKRIHKEREDRYE